MIPDIVICQDKKPVTILDAKWKRPKNDRPSPSDLQQLFTYAGHFNVNRVALLYPSVDAAGTRVQGKFLKSGAGADLLWVRTAKGPIKDWMQALAAAIESWLKE